MEITMEPKNVLHFFQEIEQIPRGSGNEKALSDWLVAFAKERNLEVKQDVEHNVIIKVPATAGYEDRPIVILQGHMDMVCEKTPESNHDFTKDPIELIVDGEWLRANGTTLGADNGIAVAMALAVVDDKSIAHGPLEILITTSEETGMNGAAAVKGADLDGKYLINIDTEIEGEFVVSCTGGCRVTMRLPLIEETTDELFTVGLTVKVDGLLGGHSGIEIYKQRANANQILARALYNLGKKFDFQIASFTGGTKHNAIPRISTAELAVRVEDVAAIKEELAHLSALMKTEYTPQDPDLAILVTEGDTPAEVLEADASEALISFLVAAPHGVLGVSKTIDNLVETSENLAIVEETEDNIEILVSIRSSNANALEHAKDRLIILADTLGLSAEVAGSYPAWQYEPGSPLEIQTTTIYEKITGKKAIINAIHAGLECGLLKGELPDTQMISFGPTIENAHTPQERLHIESAHNIFEFLKVLLKEIK